ETGQLQTGGSRCRAGSSFAGASPSRQHAGLCGPRRVRCDQPWPGFQSAGGTVLTIQGTPNRSTSAPKPGDQKVSSNGITCLPCSDSCSNQRLAWSVLSVCRVTSKPFLGLSMLGAHCASMSAPISDWSPTSSQQCISQSLYFASTGISPDGMSP